VAAFRIAGFAAFPFGKELIDARCVGEQRIAGSSLANFLWIVLAGIWLAIAHTLAGLCCFFTFFLVFPIFFGMAHFKLAKVSFAPLGKRCVSSAFAQAAIMADASTKLNGCLLGGASSSPQSVGIRRNPIA
jgi:uncharacterized membrane protein YccF (DUF307 family)